MNQSDALPDGWPSIEGDQQQEFHEWYFSRLRKEEEILQRSITNLLDVAEQAQANNSIAESDKNIRRAKELRARGAELGSTEHMRKAAWKFCLELTRSSNCGTTSPAI